MPFVLNGSTSACLQLNLYLLADEGSSSTPVKTRASLDSSQTICFVPAAQVWDAWHGLQSSQKNCSRGTTLGGRPEESIKTGWRHFVFGRTARCFGKDQRAMHCHSSCSYFSADLVHADAPPRPPPPQSARRLFARATLMCTSALVSSPLTLYTGPTPQLLVWIPLKEHYNMNEIYCAGTKCGWLPCPVIRKTMKTAWPWAPAALLCLAHD